MPTTGFTRSQLVASLLQEVTVAQASFQAAQLNAWRGVAPGAAVPNIEYLAGLDQVELQLNIKPFRKPWPARLADWILGRSETGEPRYRLTAVDDPEAMPLTIRVTRGSMGYQATTEPSDAKG
ncbi:MAG TPA: hypothetical protein VFF03_10145 [Rhodocyclaceae bacterium]|nr:hypothetical protein [Rhodocyclaceae bacterium]